MSEKLISPDKLNDKVTTEGVDCSPMLSIQQLLENAVRYGIMQLIEGGKISITVHEESDFVSVLINYNGMGIDRQLVEGLLAGKVRKAGVGLRNIHARLLKLYDKVIEITNESEAGRRWSSLSRSDIKR